MEVGGEKTCFGGETDHWCFGTEGNLFLERGEREEYTGESQMKTYLQSNWENKRLILRSICNQQVAKIRVLEFCGLAGMEL